MKKCFVWGVLKRLKPLEVENSDQDWHQNSQWLTQTILLEIRKYQTNVWTSKRIDVMMLSGGGTVVIKRGYFTIVR